LVNIHDKRVLKTALETLHRELQSDHMLPDYSPEFRKILAEGLFYRFVLSIKPENVNPKLRSGGSILKRGLSSGKHTMTDFKNIYISLFLIIPTFSRIKICYNL